MRRARGREEPKGVQEAGLPIYDTDAFGYHSRCTPPMPSPNSTQVGSMGGRILVEVKVQGSLTPHPVSSWGPVVHDTEMSPNYSRTHVGQAPSRKASVQGSNKEFQRPQVSYE